jgi:hypothetical protein
MLPSSEVSGMATRSLSIAPWSFSFVRRFFLAAVADVDWGLRARLGASRSSHRRWRRLPNSVLFLKFGMTARPKVFYCHVSSLSVGEPASLVSWATMLVLRYTAPHVPRPSTHANEPAPQRTHIPPWMPSQSCQRSSRSPEQGHANLRLDSRDLAPFSRLAAAWKPS